MFSAQVASPPVATSRPVLARTWPRWLTLGLLFAYCGILCSYGLNAGQLYRTESLRAIIAQEFLRSGNWIVPTLYGEPLLTKPPGMYAAIALASWPFGRVTEWSARLPSAFAALATIAVFSLYLRRQLGSRAGWLAALLLPMSLMWLDKAPTAEIDMLQVFWVTAALVCFLRVLEIEEEHDAKSTQNGRGSWGIGSLYEEWRRDPRGREAQGPHRPSRDKVDGDGFALPGLKTFFNRFAPRTSPWAKLFRLFGVEDKAAGSTHLGTKNKAAGSTHADGPRPAFAACNSWPWWLAALLCVAGGVLTKWTAPAFFYGTVMPLLWLRGRLRLLCSRQHCISALAGAALCFSWIGAVVWKIGWETFYSTVSREALMRLSPSHHHRPYPWDETLTHPVRIFVASLPVSLYALLSLRRGFGSGWDPRGRLLWQALHCWIWPSMLFWSLTPEHSVRHSFPLYPGIAGLAVMFWCRALECRERRSTPRVSCLFSRPALVGLLVAWLACKFLFVHVAIPGRMRNRLAQEKGEQVAALVPSAEILYLSRLKDEGITFYYGRTVRRIADPARLTSSTEAKYCILDDAEWKAWPEGHPREVLLQLRDQQGAPIYLIRTGTLAKP